MATGFIVDPPPQKKNDVHSGYCITYNIRRTSCLLGPNLKALHTPFHLTIGHQTCSVPFSEGLSSSSSIRGTAIIPQLKYIPTPAPLNPSPAYLLIQLPTSSSNYLPHPIITGARTEHRTQTSPFSYLFRNFLTPRIFVIGNPICVVRLAYWKLEPPRLMCESNQKVFADIQFFVTRGTQP